MASKQIGGGIVIFDVNTGGSGGGQNTANGISGDGSIATPIILGGNPLNQNTNIDIAGNDFSITDGAVTFDLSNAAILIYAGATLAVRCGFVFQLNSTASFFAPPASNGIIGNHVYPVASFPTANAQFAQYGNLAALVGTINFRLITLSRIFGLYNVPAAANQLLRINVAFFLNTLGATTNVQVELDYVDEGSSNVTVLLINTGTLATQTINSMTIYAEKSTSVSVKVSLNIPGASYNLYVTCEYLGIQN